MDWSFIGQATAQFFIDYVAVIIGAVTGALVAVDRDMDIVGTVAMGLVTGYGGGIIRDLLLQDQGLFFMEHPSLVIVATVASIAVFFAKGVFHYLPATVFFADTLSIAAYALAGTGKAWDADVGVILAILLGTITAVGGGAIRDVCTGEVPSIFRQSNFLAVASIAGAGAYVVLELAHAPIILARICCFATVVILRYVSVWFDLRTSAASEIRLPLPEAWKNKVKNKLTKE